MELIDTFLSAHFSGAVRHQRRLAKMHALEAAWPIRNGDPS